MVQNGECEQTIKQAVHSECSKLTVAALLESWKISAGGLEGAPFTLAFAPSSTDLVDRASEGLSHGMPLRIA